MNNNNINLQENKEAKIDLAYIMSKIDEITRMNTDLINKQNFSEMANVPGCKNPVQCICETNNKMIDFLQEIYKSLQPSDNKEIILGLTNTLNNAICDLDADEDVVNHLIDTIAKYIEK